MREGEEIRQQLSMVTMYGHPLLMKMGIPRTGGGGWRMESGRSAIGMRVGEVCGVRKTIQKLHFLPIGNGIYLSRPLGARGVHHFFFWFRRFAVELRTCTHFSRLVSPAFCNIHWYQSALHLFVNEPRQNQQTFRLPGPDPIRLL